jgi:hypothetical protein
MVAGSVHIGNPAAPIGGTAVDIARGPRWAGVDDEEIEHSIGPGTTIALIAGLIVFYGLFIAVALTRG